MARPGSSGAVKASTPKSKSKSKIKKKSSKKQVQPKKNKTKAELEDERRVRINKLKLAAQANKRKKEKQKKHQDDIIEENLVEDPEETDQFLSEFGDYIGFFNAMDPKALQVDLNKAKQKKKKKRANKCE
eukprot:TRINITY_DN1497_c0_g1_i1.p2 TRINITY_DN1497_c0_g1~~TRINITY_DN1497_c0_g1_i1.p2  ORF type:complete len:141 (-),score=57.05 TRINITY_DN1497_c0_g1_i1:479-868(-)